MDETNIKKLGAGHKETIRKWFGEYADPLYTLVYYKVGGDGDTAGDVVQETFLTALKKIEDYEPGRGSMFAWLSWLSKNCIKKALKEKSRNVSYQTDESRVDGVLSDAYMQVVTQPLPEEILEQAETAEFVRETLGSIPGRYRKVLRQYYYEQSSVREIAESQKISGVAVRVLLYRARKVFKRAFLKSAESAGETAAEKGEYNG
ncbi:MAG: RNA polymerase sigma factor [Planctomycetota bacterium]